MGETSNIKNTTDWPCGQTIVMVRTMTDTEMKNEGWQRHRSINQNPACFVLDDGSVIYPSCDQEGNGSGVFFGYIADTSFTINLSEETV